MLRFVQFAQKLVRFIRTISAIKIDALTRGSDSLRLLCLILTLSKLAKIYSGQVETLRFNRFIKFIDTSLRSVKSLFLTPLRHIKIERLFSQHYLSYGIQHQFRPQSNTPFKMFTSSSILIFRRITKGGKYSFLSFLSDTVN